MSKSTKSTAKATATATAPIAALAPTTASTPAYRGDSTVAMPVGPAWVTGFAMYFDPKGNPVTPAPTGTAPTAACLAPGLTLSTARPQRQAFLKATKGGTVLPAPGTKLPRGVVLNYPEGK